MKVQEPAGKWYMDECYSNPWEGNQSHSFHNCEQERNLRKFFLKVYNDLYSAQLYIVNLFECTSTLYSVQYKREHKTNWDLFISLNFTKIVQENFLIIK